MLVEGVLYNTIDYDTVAAYQYIGENPEEKVGDVMDEFIRTNKLYEKKPDARLFGFNHPDPEEGNPVYGYEDWVTIPDDMEVPEPLVKKHFNGGLYAAYTIKFPDFFEWKFLTEWVEKSELYEAWISLQAQLAEMQKQVIDIMLDGIIEQIL